MAFAMVDNEYLWRLPLRSDNFCSCWCYFVHTIPYTTLKVFLFVLAYLFVTLKVLSIIAPGLALFTF